MVSFRPRAERQETCHTTLLPRESSCEALIQATGLVLRGDITVAGQCRIFTGLRCISAPYVRHDIGDESINIVK